MQITADELRRRLGGAATPQVLDARWSLAGGPGRAEFAAGHLPGSRYVDLETELTDHDLGAGRHPLPRIADFAAAMRAHGVSADRPVVVIDGGDGLAAARLWWMLTGAGHLDVSLLDGGYAAWVGSGGEIETGETPPVEPGDFTAAGDDWPEVVGADDIAGVLAAGHNVWDVRAAERYRGEVEPMDPVAGHVPGARNLPDAGLHEADGRFLPEPALSERLARVAPGDVVYCGSGVTAARTLAALRLAGIAGVRLYAGSWSDWIADPARPVATGGE